MISVSNRRKERMPGSIYAGRPGPFGNPFVLHSERDRPAAIIQFRAWFLGDSSQAKAMRERALKLPSDAVLECWCAPKACHAQVIADWVNEQRAKEEK